MKHTWMVTAILLAIFLLTQVLGIYAISHSMQVETLPDGSVNVNYPDTAVGERPEMEGMDSFLFILMSIGIGTGLLLLLIKIKKFQFWKIFFFLAVWMSVTILLGVFINPDIALAIGFILAVAKLYSRNIFLLNLTEVFMYSGIAVLFAPLIEVQYMAILLVIIAIYDMIAVWKSKHMVTMAKEMTKNNIFAGFTIPYSGKKISVKLNKNQEVGKEKAKTTVAILGGGDVAFPLLFSGSVINYLVKVMGVPKNIAFLETLIIPLAVMTFLLLLFRLAKKDRFYPAMPFVSAGAFIGFGLILAINMLI
ncbi:MAG: hypothetical protein JW716_04935 [Candidatus Aenigmarchaeota archaeon]|nr:hypothetical protein [Candidatus Aenigmarchaeota archaeon]